MPKRRRDNKCDITYDSSESTKKGPRIGSVTKNAFGKDMVMTEQGWTLKNPTKPLVVPPAIYGRRYKKK